MKVWRLLVTSLVMLGISYEAVAQQNPGVQTNPCIVQQQNVQRSLEGSIYANIRCSRDGAIVEIPWQQAAGLEGRIFVANFGQQNTFINGTVNFTNGAPAANIDIPTGTTVIPLFFNVTTGTVAGTAPGHFLEINANTTGNGTSSAVTAGPFNMRLGDQPFASRITARQTYTAAGTAPTTIAEVLSGPAPVAGVQLSVNFITALPITPIVGPASISYYNFATTTASTFKAQLIWVELPSSTVQ